MATVDYFLKIDGIQGESLDAKHKGEIQLESFSWGETRAGTMAAGGGGGTGKVHVQDLHVAKKLDKASPLLFLACATGQHLKEAILTARKAGKGQLEFLVFKFRDLLVSSYQTGAARRCCPPTRSRSISAGSRSSTGRRSPTARSTHRSRPAGTSRPTRRCSDLARHEEAELEQSPDDRERCGHETLLLLGIELERPARELEHVAERTPAVEVR